MNADTVAPWLPADVVLVVHVGFAGFVVFGQIYVMLGWALRWSSARNRLFRLLHLAAIGVVVIQAWLGLICPLTLLERHLRGGEAVGGPGQSFVGYWLSRLLYYQAPPWVFTVVYTLFGALVLLCYFAYPPRPKG
jgi:hypothetical protein